MYRVCCKIVFTNCRIRYEQRLGPRSVETKATGYRYRYIIFIIHRLQALKPNMLCSYVCKYFHTKQEDRVFKFLDHFVDFVYCVYCNSLKENCDCLARRGRHFTEGYVNNHMRELFVEILSLPNNFIKWNSFYNKTFFASFTSSLFGEGHIVFSHGSQSTCYMTVKVWNVCYLVNISEWFTDGSFRYIREIIRNKCVNNVPMCNLYELCISKIICRVLHRNYINEPIIQSLCLPKCVQEMFCKLLNTSMLLDVHHIVNNNISEVKSKYLVTDPDCYLFGDAVGH